jgi:hypothetical protein
MMQTGQQTIWITVAVIVLVLARFLFRELRPRRIKTRSIFAIPIVMGLVGAAVIYTVVAIAPEQIPTLLIGGVFAILVGIGVGLAVAHFTSVQVLEPGLLLVRGSWITVAIWVGALALRLVARWFVSGGQTVVYTSASAAGGPALMLNGVLVIMLVTALATARVRFLAAAR